MSLFKPASPTVFATTDLCDAHEDQIAAGTLRALPPVFRHFGLQPGFFGPIVTVKCFEDNSMVKKLLEEPGARRVLVVDGGGSTRCALVGGNLAASGARNGWAGIVVYGAVRDRAELDDINIGIHALGLCPVRSLKRGQGEIDVPITVAGLRIVPGHWLYADRDGIVVSEQPLHGAA
jgi:regulator of ribonuclease activity A